MNRLPPSALGLAPKCGRCHRALFEGKPLALDTANFDLHAAHGQLPLLIDFWATWCGPCRVMAPEFEAAAKKLEPQLRLVKVDVDAESALSERFGIRSIPTMVLLVAGKEIARQSGAMNSYQIVHWARSQLPT